MFRTYLILGLLIVCISSIEYNQRCTFSFGTCNWYIGRRWQIKNLDDEIDDKVLIATDGNNQDKELGFTDIITSSWLYLTSSCSYDIRLTFQFSIENEQDQIEIFLIKKNDLHISSIGQWKALTNRNSSNDIESLWQQVNITFKAAEEFRIEIEIRHLPDKKFDSTIWFAVDDILIEDCLYNQPVIISEQIISTTPLSLNLSNHQFSRFNHILNNRMNSSYDESLSSHITFFTFILYTLCTLIAIALIIILLAIIIFIYRKYCFPSSKLSRPIIDRSYHSSRRKKHNHIDQDARTERTMVTTIRPY